MNPADFIITLLFIGYILILFYLRMVSKDEQISEQKIKEMGETIINLRIENGDLKHRIALLSNENFSLKHYQPVR